MNSTATAIRTSVSAPAADGTGPVRPVDVLAIPSLTTRGREVLQILNDVFDSHRMAADGSESPFECKLDS